MRPRSSSAGATNRPAGTRFGPGKCAAARFCPRSGAIGAERPSCRVSLTSKIRIFTWSAELQALYQVRGRHFFVRPNDIRLHKPHETNETDNTVRIQDRAFSFSRAPDLWIHKNRTRRVREIPSPRRRAGGARTSPDPLCPYSSCRAFRPTEAIYGGFFSRDPAHSVRKRRNGPKLGAAAPSPEALRAPYGREATQWGARNHVRQGVRSVNFS